MKIVVHMNDTAEESYLLVFNGKIVQRDRIKRLIDRNDHASARSLLKHSNQRHVLLLSQKRKAEVAADFVMSPNDYSVERLA